MVIWVNISFVPINIKNANVKNDGYDPFVAVKLQEQAMYKLLQYNKKKLKRYIEKYKWQT